MGAVLTAGELRKGLKIEIDGEPYLIVDFEFSKPGKGQALYRCRLKNMITGAQFDRTYRSGDKFNAADLEEQEMQYLYNDGQSYHFMNMSSYEQIEMPAGTVGDASSFLIENLVVNVLLFQGRPIGLTLPNFVDLKIVNPPPESRATLHPGRPNRLHSTPAMSFRFLFSSKKAKPSESIRGPASTWSA